jgi:hypothetical protein
MVETTEVPSVLLTPRGVSFTAHTRAQVAPHQDAVADIEAGAYTPVMSFTELGALHLVAGCPAPWC